MFVDEELNCNRYILIQDADLEDNPNNFSRLINR